MAKLGKIIHKLEIYAVGFVSRFERHASLVFLFILLCFAALGSLILALYSLHFRAYGESLRIFGVGMMVAGAALLSGFLLGFIFAIPRMEPQRKPSSDSIPEADKPADLRHHSSPYNGNLVEISDWLTKIIVGVGLVELHSILRTLGSFAYSLAPGLLPSACANGGPRPECFGFGQTAGLSILVFYSTLGFLLGYVWTIIYFTGSLKQQQENFKLREENKRIEQQKTKSTHDATLVLKVEKLVGLNQFKEAMEIIDEALQSDPSNGYFAMTKARVLKRQASLNPPERNNLLQQAIAFANLAITLMPGEAEPIYNKACYQTLFNLNGLKSEIMDNLKTAFRINSDLRKSAQNDEDLNDLREDDDFKKLIK